jgi:hypothetical protein
MELSPGVDFAPKVAHRKNPLAAADRMKVGSLLENEEHVPGGHQGQVAQGERNLGQGFAKGPNPAADALDRNAGVDQSLDRLEGHQIFKGVSVVAALRLDRRFDQIGLSPVLELPP